MKKISKHGYLFIFIDNENKKREVVIKASSWAVANKRFNEQYICKEIIRAFKYC